jgi:helicase
MLARRVRWGAPPEILDIIRMAQKGGVPGFGRQRAMALLAQGLTTIESILTTGREKILSILRNERRTDDFLTAMTSSMVFGGNRYARIHQTVADTLGLSDIAKRCAEELGTSYEEAIKSLLETELRWSVKVIDDGKQQNVPDLLLQLGKKTILLECKTTTKKVPLIKKEEAFAILQKAVDFDGSFHRVSLGKPAFDEHSKKKVQAATGVTLVEHAVFMEGILRVLTGSVSPDEFLDWLSAPGLAEIDRLGGERTTEILQRST